MNRILLNKVGYDPVDTSPTNTVGYKRPPQDAAAVLDYFDAIRFMDMGEFAVCEAEEMLNFPEHFFDPSIEDCMVHCCGRRVGFKVTDRDSILRDGVILDELVLEGRCEHCGRILKISSAAPRRKP